MSTNLPKQSVIELDVREDLLKKLEPFQKIMSAVEQVKENDLFILHTTFKPVPLFAVMKKKGFEHHAEQLEEKHWRITFSRNPIS